MKRQYAVVASSLVFLATFVACRAIVGITELTVDAGVDAAADVPAMPDARMETGAVDASLDTRADASVDGRPVDAHAEADCSQLESSASMMRAGCLDGCNMGHSKQITSFFTAEFGCICSSKVCGDVCGAYCNFRGCNMVDPEGECFNCAAFAAADPGGLCKTDAALECAGCVSYAQCLASCPDE
jgi:hypothetical protein